MVTESPRRTARVVAGSVRALRVPDSTWALVLLSRVVPLVCGTLGATLAGRVTGWEQFDPTRITQHLGAIGDVLAGSLVRWDSIHYLQIAAHGYDRVATTVFFPLYPALIALVSPVVHSPVIAGVLISVASFATALVLLYRLTVEEFGVSAARATVLLLAFAPTGLFFSAVYTESLFLALSLAAFLAGRRGRWRAAAAWAAAATLTRVPGVLLLVPLAIMYLEARRREPVRPTPRQMLPGALPLLLIPLALGSFFAYLDLRGYGPLAPITNQVTLHGHGSAGPIATVTSAVRDGISGAWQLATGAQAPAAVASGPTSAALTNLIELTVFAISVATLVLAYRRLPRAYAAYAALVLLLCVWSPSPVMPMQSLNRYVLVIFPLWMVAGEVLSRRRLVLAISVLGAGMMAMYTFEFAQWAFVA